MAVFDTWLFGADAVEKQAVPAVGTAHAPEAHGSFYDLMKMMAPTTPILNHAVFDDIVRPLYPYFRAVWNRTVGFDPRYAAWEITQLGCGVAVVVRVSD